MKYYVSITEFLQRTVSVDAPNEEEAVKTVRKAYEDGRIVLSSKDYVDKCIETEEDQEYFRANDAMRHAYERID